MNCTNCKSVIDEDSSFCHVCAAPTVVECAECGKQISLNSTFCKYCAQEVTAHAPQSTVEVIAHRGQAESAEARPKSATEMMAELERIKATRKTLDRSIELEESFEDEETRSRKNSNTFIYLGSIAAGISLILFLWSYSYTNNYGNMAVAGFSRAVGNSDPTYEMAKLLVTASPVTFVIGIVLAVVGFTKR